MPNGSSVLFTGSMKRIFFGEDDVFPISAGFYDVTFICEPFLTPEPAKKYNHFLTIKGLIEFRSTWIQYENPGGIAGLVEVKLDWM